MIESIPEALSETEFVCSSVNIGSTKAGINMDAVKKMGNIVKEAALRTADRGLHRRGEARRFLQRAGGQPVHGGRLPRRRRAGLRDQRRRFRPGRRPRGHRKGQPEDDITAIADIIKKTAFKITRMGQLVAQEASRRLCVPFGIVDLSLAPTPAIGDSVADILEAMGLEQCGAHGTTAALALLNDAVKKGGVMASSHVGGLSGAFIPVSEDQGMIAAAKSGALSITKLEAMTAVCSVGLDMIVVPGDITPEIISGIIADEAAIGMVNSKTTAVRLIPAIGKQVGDELNFGGLLGSGPVMEVNAKSPAVFVRRGGRIPAPLQSLKN